jgi:hypothetical protein
MRACPVCLKMAAFSTALPWYVSDSRRRNGERFICLRRAPTLSSASLHFAFLHVTRLLPKEGTEYQYHIPTEPDGQQRRAQER